MAVRGNTVRRDAGAAGGRPGGLRRAVGARVVGPWFLATATATFDALQTLDPAGAAAARAAGFAPPDEADQSDLYPFPVRYLSPFG